MRSAPHDFARRSAFRLAPGILALALASCGSPTEGTDDAGPIDRLDASSPSDAGTPHPDAPIELDASDPTLVTAPLIATRELRGAWIPSVFNLVYPSSSSLGEAQARAEIIAILDVMEELRMNAAFVQIRPESDALYASTIEPWSRFLSGTQGRDPGWDPLATWITEGHARNIEIHAWINPYRGMASASATTATNHVTRTLAEHAHPYGSLIVMDPGAPAVRAHVVRVVRDVVARYEVDGIHFDDYFYPYPNATRDPFPDDATWNAYLDGGGTLSRGDWRRQNVNDLVRDVSVAIAEERNDVRFGISPFGIYRPGMPPGISGLDAYAEIYCDPLRWLEEGWVDYVAPQLYWPTTQAAQDFDLLLEWWAGQASEGRTILAGMNVTKLGSSDAWTLDELRAQLSAVDGNRSAGVSGSIAYHLGPFLENTSGVRDMYRDEFWTEPAMTPPLASASGAAPPSPPVLSREGGTVRIEHGDRASLRAFAIYLEGPAGWSLSRIVPAASDVTTLDAATASAITAIDRRGNESLARRTPLD